MKLLGKGVNKLNNVDPADLVKIVQKYSGYVSGLSRRYYISGGTYDDLFEEGVIGILEACKNYNGESLFDDKFEPFVKLCIKRQIIDAIKKSNAQKNKILNESISLTKIDSNGEEDSILNNFIDRNTSNDPLDLFIDREKIDERLRICEEELSKFERQVLTHYLSGKKQNEIAKSLDRDVKSIDNTLQRIKLKLK